MNFPDKTVFFEVKSILFRQGSVLAHKKRYPIADRLEKD